MDNRETDREECDFSTNKHWFSFLCHFHGGDCFHHQISVLLLYFHWHGNVSHECSFTDDLWCPSQRVKNLSHPTTDRVNFICPRSQIKMPQGALRSVQCMIPAVLRASIQVKHSPHHHHQITLLERGKNGQNPKKSHRGEIPLTGWADMQ